MLKKTLGLGLLAAFGMIGCGGGEQSIGCPVQRISWAAKYELVDPSQASLPCGGLTGEQLGLQRYNDPRDPDAPQVVAIRPRGLFGSNSATSSAAGTLASEPTDGVCEATDLSVATSDDGSTSWEFTNVKFLVTPTAPGSLLEADLKYTEGSCTANYKVTGVWPALPCGSDEDCAPGVPFVNPDFNLACLQASNPPVPLCMPATPFPSQRG